MLGEDLGRRPVGERSLEAHAAWPPRQTIHQSGRASPGAGRKRRWREMRRSELVTVPSFSPQAAAGSLTCAWRAVSVSAVTSETTTNGQAADRRLDARRHPASRRPGWSP